MAPPHVRALAILSLSLLFSAGRSHVNRGATAGAPTAAPGVHTKAGGRLLQPHLGPGRGGLSLRGGSSPLGGEPVQPALNPRAPGQSQEHSWLKELINTPRPTDVFKGAFDVFADEVSKGSVPAEAWGAFLEGIQEACEDAIDTFRREYQKKPDAGHEGRRGVFFVVLEGAGLKVRTELCQGLLAAGRNVTAVDFPPHSATTPTRRIIKEIESCGRPIDRKTRHSLRAACRWECAAAIRDLLSQGVDLVAGNSYTFCDVARSTSPFQKLSLKWCKELEHGLPAPDRVIYVQGDERDPREGDVAALQDDTWVTIPSSGEQAAADALPKAIEFCDAERPPRRYLWPDM